MLATGRGPWRAAILLILDELPCLSPLLVEELFALIQRINGQGVAFCWSSRTWCGAQSRHRAYILERSVVLDGASDHLHRRNLKRAYLDYDHVDAQTFVRDWRAPIVVAREPRCSHRAPRRAGRVSTLYVSGRPLLYPSWTPRHRSRRHEPVVDTTAMIRDRVGAYLVVDADTGYGNALNVSRTSACSSARGRTRFSSKIRHFPSDAGISTKRR